MYNYRSRVKFRRWTIQAKKCYERGCVCTGCEVYEVLGRNCRMKASVLELVRVLGKPPKEKIKESEE